jgi:DNA-binding response OmpR family regulator
MAIPVLALERDLFFAVRMRDTLQHHDIAVITARTLPAFEQHLQATGPEKPALVIVNTATRGVDWEAAIRAARAQAGAQKVVANSKFTSDMPGLVRRLLSDPTSTGERNEEI